jgi:hypothetical protein
MIIIMGIIVMDIISPILIHLRPRRVKVTWKYIKNVQTGTRTCVMLTWSESMEAQFCY